MPESEENRISVAGKRAKKQRSLQYKIIRFLLALATVATAAIIAIFVLPFGDALPFHLLKQYRSIEAPQYTARARPLYLWDYALVVDEEKLGQYEVVIPYAKGPPSKLLNAIYLRNIANHEDSLELFGKRPRTYDRALIEKYFENTNLLSGLTKLGMGGLLSLSQLTRETGTSWAYSSPSKREITLTEIEIQKSNRPKTIAVGTPFSQSYLKFIYIGTKGETYQVRCGRSDQFPCSFRDELTSAVFSEDASASRTEKVEWTKSTIQSLLVSLSDMPQGDKRERRENLVSLYLASYLTLEPRDPEAYFHLGKLAHNKETARAAIRYGHDVGLAPEKIAELQGTEGE